MVPKICQWLRQAAASIGIGFIWTLLEKVTQFQGIAAMFAFITCY